MNSEHLKWLAYWKKNLSDSLNTDIKTKDFKYFELESFSMESEFINDLENVNYLIDSKEKKINEKKGISDKENKEWIHIDETDIIIAPFKLKPIPEHLIYLQDKNSKLPFWFFAKLNRLGKLSVPEETFPLFQRKYLEPLAEEKTEFIFGSVNTIDEVAPHGKEEYKTYREYTDYIKKVFSKVTAQQISLYSTKGYQTISNAIILLADEDMHIAKSIIELYDKIIQKKEGFPLLEALITLENNTEKPPLSVSEFTNSNDLHLGQMEFKHSLSVSQRKSLYTLLHSDDKVFAVNGPPGTGKTTLLQSIVASKVVETALNGSLPPIILACSTNNQAVTNIIDSFSKATTKKGPLQDRWLPNVQGYATYLPSNSKTEAELKGINYKTLRGNGLFNRIENFSFLNEAKVYYLEKCSLHFDAPILNIKEATQRLQNEIKAVKKSLTEAKKRWKDYTESEKLFISEYPLADMDTAQYYKEGLLNESVLKDEANHLLNTEKELIAYFRHEPFIRKFLCFLGSKSALSNRLTEIRVILRNSPVQLPKESGLKKTDLLNKVNHKIEILQKITESIVNWKTWKLENQITGNPPDSEKEYWEFELLKIKDGAEPNCFYDELDVSHRHTAFQLALHYWEGEYLLQLEKDLPSPAFDKKGKNIVINRWQRQAMLTPCFVSTFHSAPNFFSYSKFFKKAQDGTNIYDSPPLFNFIDLLIVDEAGQVTPEVGIPTFALAKQAVVVGDIKQIEPIWSVSNKIDIGNLKKSEIINDYDNLIYEDEYDAKGFLSSTGSLMKMAQNACSYKETLSHEKGVFLSEHRRCYDEIISYCNTLAYDGKLIPLRGKAKDDLLFPPMYCIHTEGGSEKDESGSRFNLNEVKAITDWLKENKQKIEDMYKTIEESVGIITPFTAQKNKLISALKQAGFKTDYFKIGTVHALQGAERPIILFSMVYGEEDTGIKFFDRDNKPNMLNVAVSRAKDNFIVFANTKILDKRASTPSGILSKFLKYNFE